MKPTKTILKTLILTCSLAVTTYSQSFLTNGLVAYFPFNGNANDASGHNVSTSVTGNYGFTTDQGKPCLSLNTGLTPPTLPQPVGMVSVTRPASLSPTADITISTWLSIDRLLSGTFPSTGNDDLIHGPHVHTILSFGDMGFAGYNIIVKTFTNQTPDFIQVIGGDYNYAVRANLSTLMGQWNHLVVTKSSGRYVTAYWNGSVLATGTLAGPGNPSQIMLIGKGPIPVPFDFPMIGSLASFRAYNGVLSAAEVQQLYQYGTGPKVSIIKAVKPSFEELSPGNNYQMQISADMNTWTNEGSAFTATNTSMIYPQYFDVANWNKLFFRLEDRP